MNNLTYTILNNPITFDITEDLYINFYMSHASHDVGFNFFPSINGLTIYNLSNYGSNSHTNRVSIVVNDKTLFSYTLSLKAGQCSPLIIIPNLDMSKLLPNGTYYSLTDQTDSRNSNNPGEYYGNNYRVIRNIGVFKDKSLGKVIMTGHSSNPYVGGILNHKICFNASKDKIEKLIEKHKLTGKFYTRTHLEDENFLRVSDIDRIRNVGQVGNCYAAGNGLYNYTNGSYVPYTCAYYVTYMSGNKGLLIANKNLVIIYYIITNQNNLNFTSYTRSKAC